MNILDGRSFCALIIHEKQLKRGDILEFNKAQGYFSNVGNSMLCVTFDGLSRVSDLGREGEREWEREKERERGREKRDATHWA